MWRFRWFSTDAKPVDWDFERGIPRLVQMSGGPPSNRTLSLPDKPFNQAKYIVKSGTKMLEIRTEKSSDPVIRFSWYRTKKCLNYWSAFWI